jgi:hypothetical protein
MPSDLSAIQSQPAARKVFTWLAEAEIEDKRTTVEDLIEHCQVSRRSAINLLRALDRAGVGEFKVGRKGHPSRFEWDEDPQAVAERFEQLDGSDGHDDEHEPDEPDVANAKSKANGRAHGQLFDDALLQAEPARRGAARDVELSSRPSGPEMIEHNYVLRPRLRVSVQLPADLSAREAEVLGEWLRNISFER